MRGLLAAAAYLTVVPLPPAARAGAPGPAAAWFPVVGLALGGAVAAVDRVAGWFLSPALAAVVAVTAWKGLTGGLHLDGLADCLDGLGGRGPADRLRLMADGRIGSFGAIALVLVLLATTGAVAELADPYRWRVLLVAPAVGRATPPLLARLFPAARPGGQGATFREGVRPAAPAVAAGVALAAAGLLLGRTGAAAMVAATLVALGVAALMHRKLGGITGDVLGAAVELAELTLLVVVVAWTRPR